MYKYDREEADVFSMGNYIPKKFTHLCYFVINIKIFFKFSSECTINIHL